jgi:hypothetical protein
MLPTMEELLEAVFSVWFMQRPYNGEQLWLQEEEEEDAAAAAAAAVVGVG